MFDVYFFNHFKKRYNSTLRPSGGVNIPCNIVSETDAKNPTLEVRGYNAGYNYVYIPLFSSYYYVHEKKYNPEKNFWIVSCEKDVLATYKTEIGSSNLLITRCQNGSLQSYMEDTQLPTLHKSRTTLVQSLSSIGFQHYFESGTVCLQIVGQGTILLSGAGWNILNNALCSPGNNPFTNFTQWLGEDFFKAMADPVKYIKSAVWLPIDYNNGAFYPVISVPPPLSFGYYNISLGALRPIDTNMVLETTFEIPEHPQTSVLGEWTNLSPYTQIIIYAPFIGALAIPVKNKINALIVRFSIDVLTGSVSVQVSDTGAGTTLATGGGNIGCPMLIGQITQPILGVLSGVGTAVTGLLSGNPLAIGAGAAGIGKSILGGNDVQSTGLGSGVSALGMSRSLLCTVNHQILQDRNNAHLGKPYFIANSPENLGGYMQVRDGYNVFFQGDIKERQEIAGILERGFYYE